MTKDRYLATAVLLVVAILFFESGNIPDKTSWQAYESSLYPRILLGCIATLALLLLFNSFRSSASEETVSVKRETPTKRPERNLKVLGIFVLFGSYAALLPFLGYLIATMAFMVTTQALLLGIDTRRKWAINLVTAGILVPLIYVIFEYGLNVWLP